MHQERAGTRTTGSGCAAVTMVGKGDRCLLKSLEAFDIPYRRLVFPQREIQHLVEIAIVDPPIPTNRDEISAHHPLSRLLIEVVAE